MLRVGLTGDLGSGKSTVAAMLAARGAVVLSSDEMARAMMSPGQPVFEQIVARFGASIVSADGTLNRRELARIAFDPAKPHIAELNTIVHPAVIAAQADNISALSGSHAIVVIESALIFSTKPQHGAPWRERFDRILLVTAPEEQKIARFVERAAAGRTLCAAERAALVADAMRRLSEQHKTAEHATECLVLPNDGTPAELEQKVDLAWNELLQMERAHPTP